MSNEKERSKDDIFREAAEESIKITPKQPVREIEVVDEEEVHAGLENNRSIELAAQQALAIAATIEGDQWDNLTKYINGAGAQRLIAELHTMNSRDFVRNYLKVLEHFKPKLVRSDSSPDEEIDRTIEIELTQQMPDGEIRTFNLNKHEKKSKK